MRIRDGNARDSSFTPAVLDHPPGRVLRRRVAPVIEAEPPVRRFVLDEPALTAARSRGGTNAAKHKIPRPLRNDAPLWDALRETSGNVTHAAELLGRDRGTVRQNLSVRVRRGVVPPDVEWLLAHPRRRPTVRPGSRLHTPESRALISIRVREYHAARKAVA